jgi:hypothetical protein
MAEPDGTSGSEVRGLAGTVGRHSERLRGSIGMRLGCIERERWTSKAMIGSLSVVFNHTGDLLATAGFELQLWDFKTAAIDRHCGWWL